MTKGLVSFQRLKNFRFLTYKWLHKLVRQRMDNSILANRLQWSGWNWSQRGEEWSNSAEWKRSLIDGVIKPNVPPGSRTLEIGCGAGRWSEVLAERASLLFLVDLTQEAIDICKARFGNRPGIHLFVNDGKDLGFIEAGSIDRIWSWDVFVHMRTPDVENYIRQFAVLLAPGGRAIIHHSKQGKNNRGWRSDMTAQTMLDLCASHGLVVVKQFDSWGKEPVRIWPDLGAWDQPDTVTIMARADSP